MTTPKPDPLDLFAFILREVICGLGSVFLLAMFVWGFYLFISCGGC